MHKLTESSTLFLYSKLKNDIILEPYLLQLSNFKNRQLIAKFRSSGHNLEIEKVVAKIYLVYKDCAILATTLKMKITTFYIVV